MGRGQTVFPQKTVQTFPFHLMLYTSSGRSEPSYFTFAVLNFILTLCLSLTTFFASIIFLHSRVAQLVWGNLSFNPVHA